MNNEKQYVVASICKNDVLECFLDRDNYEKAKKKLDKMDDHKMELLAKRLFEDYCNQIFWQSLRIIFEDEFL